MTLIFPTSDPPEGFENGDFSAWTGTPGSPRVQSAVTHHGSNYAMLCDAQESAYKTISSASTCYARVYFRASGYPSGAEGDKLSIVALRVGSTTLAAVRLYRDSGSVKWSLFYRNNTYGYQELSTQNIPDLDEWHCVELMTRVGSGDGEARFWLDGTELLSHTGLTNNDQGAGVTRVECGNYLSQGTVPELFYDCVVAADAYIGPETENNLEVDNLIVNQQTTLRGNAPQIDKNEPPLVLKPSSGSGNILFQDNGETTLSTNLYLVTIKDGGDVDPILATDHGLWIEKDIQTYGVLFTNSDPAKGDGGGAILMGHGFTSSDDEPQFTLLDTVGGGSGAAATLTVDQDGKITAVNVTNHGSGYKFADVTVINTNGSGARLAPVIVDGEIQSISVFESGAGYSSSDTVHIANDPHDTLYLQKVNSSGATEPAHLHLGDLIVTGELRSDLDVGSNIITNTQRISLGPDVPVYTGEILGRRDANLRLLAASDGFPRAIELCTQAAETAGIGNPALRLIIGAGVPQGSAGITSYENIQINKTNPELNLQVNSATKASFSFDGTDAQLTSNTGKIKINPAGDSVVATKDLHIDKAAPTLNLVNGTVKAAFGFDGANTHLLSNAGGIVISPNSGNTTFNGSISFTGALPLSNMAQGTSGWFLKGQGASAPTYAALAANDIPNLDAAKVTTGTFDTARIPNLDAAKITSGTFSADRIPSLDASKITAGVFSTDRIPNLNASKITSGEFDSQRINWDEIQSSVYPNTTDTYSLGSGDKRWLGANIKDIYAATVSATGVIQGASGGGPGNAFKIGNDAFLADINEGNVIAIVGAYTASLGGIAFGNDSSPSNTKIWRSASGYLRTNANWQVGDSDYNLWLENDAAKILFGNRNNSWDTKLTRVNAGVLAVQDGNGDAATFDCSNLFVDHMNSLSGGVITLFKSIVPDTEWAYWLGTDAKPFNGIYAYYVMYKEMSTSWDSVDDLDLVRRFKAKGSVIDPECLKHLEDENGFFSLGKINGWHFSIQKKLLEEIDALKQELAELKP